VFWAWLAGSFVLWLLAGYGAWKYFAAKRGPYGAFAGIALLLLGMGVLCGLFLFLTATNRGQDGLSTIQMAITTLAGGLFTGTQAAAAAVMLSTVEPVVTNRRPPPSIIEKPEGLDS
jgi:hypothetical protein